MRRAFGTRLVLSLLAVLAMPTAARAASVSHLPVPGSGALGAIATGDDGLLWIADATRADRMTTGGRFGAAVDSSVLNGSPVSFVADDNGMWLSDSSGMVQLVSVGTVIGGTSPLQQPTGTSPQSLVLGADRRVAWVDPSGDLNRGDPLTLNIETHTFSGSRPTGVAYGPDGTLWVTLSDQDAVVPCSATDLTPSTAVQLSPGSGPTSIAAGADGALWVTEETGNRIARVTPEGTVTEYAIPTADSSPESITLGPDGAMWFVESNADKVAKVTADGTITEYALPSGSDPVAITAGPDGAMWFTEAGTHSVGRVTTGPDVQGPQGDPGTPGSQGAPGPQGEAGAKGDTGSQGAKGDTGDRGKRGARGNRSGSGRPATALRASCKITRRANVKGGKQQISVRCNVRGAREGRATLAWKVMLGRKTVAHGSHATRSASAVFMLPPVARAPRGHRYQLVITPARPAPPSVKLKV